MSLKSDQETSVAILDLLKKQARPVRVRKLVRLLGLPIDSRRRVRRLLQGLVGEGRVVAEGRGRYSLVFEQKEVEGLLIKKGRCFRLLPIEFVRSMELDIHPDDRAGALPGDRVRVVSLSGRSKGSASGRVTEILQRGQRPVLGTYRQGRRGGLVVPDDPQLKESYYLDQDTCPDLRDGTMVAISVNGRIEEGRRRAKLCRVLGEPGELSTELGRIVVKHGLRDEFTPEVEQELDRSMPGFAGSQTRDLRKLPHVTIDPQDARDFDDAVFVERLGSGFRLWVSIADVSSYVAPRSAVDAEAFTRGLSVYFPSGVYPMLPPRLSEDLCTLAPGRDRYAVTVELEIGSRGEVIDGWVYRTLIRSVACLSYREVQQTLDGQPTEKTRSMQDGLRVMADCAGLLLDRMAKRGSLELDLPEQEILLDENKQPIEVAPAQRLFAHRIIETFMITANETIAGILLASEAPGIYRVHPPPDAEKMEAFFGMAEVLGARARVPNGIPSPRQLANYLQDVRDMREKPVLHQLLLRSLMQARYDSTPRGHFGLASTAYLHFTSPIRRYPDLSVHRQLGVLLDQAGPQGICVNDGHIQAKWLYSEQQAVSVAEWCTQAERRAQEAERAASRLYQAAYMQRHLGEVFEARVSFVMDFGVFVHVMPSGVEGLVHVSKMADDYFRYLPEQIMLIGRRTGKTYRAGDRVKVKVDSVQLSRGEVDLSFVDG